MHTSVISCRFYSCGGSLRHKGEALSSHLAELFIRVCLLARPLKNEGTAWLLDPPSYHKVAYITPASISVAQTAMLLHVRRPTWDFAHLPTSEGLVLSVGDTDPGRISLEHMCRAFKTGSSCVNCPCPCLGSSGRPCIIAHCMSMFVATLRRRLTAPRPRRLLRNDDQPGG